MSEEFKETTEAIRRELSNKRKLAKDLQEKIGKESGSLETNYIIQCMKLLQDRYELCISHILNAIPSHVRICKSFSLTSLRMVLLVISMIGTGNSSKGQDKYKEIGVLSCTEILYH